MGRPRKVSLCIYKIQCIPIYNQYVPTLNQFPFSIFTSSSDNTICHWSHETGERVTKYVDHTDYVNCLDCHKEASHTIIASGSDDATLRLWDSRVKKSIQTFKGEYQVFSTALNKDNNMAFSAGVDGKIYAWDIRANSISFDINAHQDAITGIKLSPDGLALLTFSANNALNIFDIRLGIPENTRLQNSFAGCVHGFEKNLVRPCWSPDGYHVACGSADMTVMVWDVITKNIVYKLPGHKGAINEVDWWDNLLLSCSNDQTMFIGEIDIESVNI